MTINVWENVQVLAQTAIATAKTITGISQAVNPVVSLVGHGYQNGDKLLLTVSGIRNLNYRVVEIGSVTTDSFTVLGPDVSTANGIAGTFFSGTAAKLTINASASTFQDVNASGGEPSTIDISTIHDSEARELPGRNSAVSYSFGSLWDPADPCLQVLKAAANIKAAIGIIVLFATGDRVMFYAYPSANLLPTGSSGAPVTTPVSFKLRGPLNYMAAA